jgi:hypothetical protein
VANLPSPPGHAKRGAVKAGVPGASFGHVPVKIHSCIKIRPVAGAKKAKSDLAQALVSECPGRQKVRQPSALPPNWNLNPPSSPPIPTKAFGPQCFGYFALHSLDRRVIHKPFLFLTSSPFCFPPTRSHNFHCAALRKFTTFVYLLSCISIDIHRPLPVPPLFDAAQLAPAKQDREAILCLRQHVVRHLAM